MDEMFHIVKRAHTSTGHGDRDKILKALTKYANVTRDIVGLYKSFCSECLQKRKQPTVKGETYPHKRLWFTGLIIDTDVTNDLYRIGVKSCILNEKFLSIVTFYILGHFMHFAL